MMSELEKERTAYQSAWGVSSQELKWLTDQLIVDGLATSELEALQLIQSESSRKTTQQILWETRVENIREKSIKSALSVDDDSLNDVIFALRKAGFASNHIQALNIIYAGIMNGLH